MASGGGNGDHGGNMDRGGGGRQETLQKTPGDTGYCPTLWSYFGELASLKQRGLVVGDSQ